MKEEFSKLQDGGQPTPEIMSSILSVKKESASREARRRKSSVTTVTEEEMPTAEAPEKPDEVIEEMEELKEEVDEARKLAEEWELKYKEMQHQLQELESGGPSFSKKNSTAGFERPTLQRGLSTTSSGGP